MAWTPLWAIAYAVCRLSSIKSAKLTALPFFDLRKSKLSQGTSYLLSQFCVSVLVSGGLPVITWISNRLAKYTRVSSASCIGWTFSHSLSWNRWKSLSSCSWVIPHREYSKYTISLCSSWTRNISFMRRRIRGSVRARTLSRSTPRIGLLLVLGDKTFSYQCHELV